MQRVQARDVREAVPAGAAAWLWARQSPDGAWRSETYGLLRSGQALTPFLLHALLGVPETVCPRPRGGVERALAFLRAGVNADGLSGLADAEVPEYPTYATAYALRCLAAAERPGDSSLIGHMAAALLKGQLADLPSAHPAHGGWGFGLRPPGGPGHMDVCHTRHALQGLREAGALTPRARSAAERFLRFVQRHPSDERPQPPDAHPTRGVPYDGGFYFSPVVLAASKGGVAQSACGTRYYASYATATCEGLLALVAAGVTRSDERVRAAARWLERHPRLDHPAGVPQDDPQRWGESVHYYHLAARGEAWAAVGGPPGWEEDLLVHLAARQRRDGSFLNPTGHLMKEDDPLLCSGLALVAAVGARGG